MEYMYGALLLHKLGKEVSEDNVKSVVASTGTEVDEAKIKSLVASLKNVDIDKELESASLVSSAPAESSGAGSSEAKEEKKEKPKEEKKEAAAEGLSALFG
jgi:large subunit ribosomal protein L12|tara:strand:- start:411 stop:713 length:303 start_codon:yes stop_codon:yes gene_type:complete